MAERQGPDNLAHSILNGHSADFAPVNNSLVWQASNHNGIGAEIWHAPLLPNGADQDLTLNSQPIVVKKEFTAQDHQLPLELPPSPIPTLKDARQVTPQNGRFKNGLARRIHSYLQSA